MTVFDLEVEIDGERYSSPASVFVRGRDAGDLRLVLASDVHVATRWDEIEADVSRLFPPRAAPPRPSDAPDATFAPRDAWSRDCFLSSFVNPNRNLVALLKTVNRMAERGEIDAVFLVGDLVDYKYSRPRRESGDGFADSEWSLLERILLGTYPSAERLTVPLFTSTGNHDYRLYPYKLQIYGLRHCAIPDSLTTELLQRAGTRQGFAYRPEDLDALRIDTGPTHSLDFYHRHFSPLEDWALDLGGLRLVALDTGPDYFCDASHLRTARFLRFVRGLRSALDPYSNGFSDEQARFLDEALRAHPEGPALVLAHAPLMNAPGEGAAKPGGATRQLPAALGEPLRSSEEPAKRARRFEGLLSETELDEGVVFQNQLPVLEAMRRHPGPVMMASGHNHWHFEIGWDGAGGGFRIDPKASQGPLDRRPASEVLLYQGPALGHVKRNDLRTGIPSYTVVQADSKSLRSVELRRLRERPYDAWLYEWEATPASTRETRVRVQFESQRETAPDAPVSYHKVIFWESPPGSGSRATGRRAWRVKAPGDDVVSFRESGEEAGGAWTSFVVRDVPVATFLLEGRLGRPPLSLLFETFEVRVGAASSLGLRWHHRLLR